MGVWLLAADLFAAMSLGNFYYMQFLKSVYKSVLVRLKQIFFFFFCKALGNIKALTLHVYLCI